MDENTIKKSVFLISVNLMKKSKLEIVTYSDSWLNWEMAEGLVRFRVKKIKKHLSHPKDNIFEKRIKNRHARTASASRHSTFTIQKSKWHQVNYISWAINMVLIHWAITYSFCRSWAVSNLFRINCTFSVVCWTKSGLNNWLSPTSL